MPATASAPHAMPATRAISGSPVRLDMLAQTAQRTENPGVVLVVGPQLDAVRLGDCERDLQHVDRIKAEAVAVQGRRRVEFTGLDIQLECRDDDIGQGELLRSQDSSLNFGRAGASHSYNA